MENINLKLDFARPDYVRAINDLMRESWIATYPNEEYGISIEDILPAFEMTEEEEKRRKECFVSNPPGPGYWVVRNENEVCGYIRVKILDDGRGKISGLYVHPKYFGKGVAQILMETALDFVQNCDEFYVECTAHNDRATRFYEKYGFKVDSNINTPNFKLSTGKEMPERTLRKIQK